MKVLLPLLRSVWAYRSLLQMPSSSPSSSSALHASSEPSQGQEAITTTTLLPSHHRHSFPDLPPLAGNAITRLWVVRHGQTDWNAEGRLQGSSHDIPLNKDGLQQAAAVANVLTAVNANSDMVVVSSPLARATETADVIAKRFQQMDAASSVVRIIHPKFSEMRFGSYWEGRFIQGSHATDSDKAAFRAFSRRMATADPSMAWPGGGESLDDVRRRGRAGLAQVLRDFGRKPNHQICLVAHGRFNKILLQDLLGLTGEAISQGNACINVVDVLQAEPDGELRYQAHVLNHVQHLSDK